MRKRNKRWLGVCMAAIVAGGSFAAGSSMGSYNCIQVQASQESDMQDVLDLYEDGEYKAAASKAAQCPKKAEESCVSDMSKKMKQAYLKKVKKYNNFSQYLKNFGSGEAYIWNYYLTDFTGDGNAELLIKSGTCEADVCITVYKYSNGKAKKIGKFYCGHTMLYVCQSGVLVANQYMNQESIDKYFLSNGKVKKETIGSRKVADGEKYLKLPYRLDDHTKKSGNVSYKALQD